MALFDDILGKVSDHPEIGNLAEKIGIDPKLVEQAVAALGEGHQRPGDTIDFASAKTGLDTGVLGQIVEHIGGADGDSRAMCEFIRVLKPGGLLVVSVPFGNRFVEQQRVGFAGAARRTGDQEHYFFQRIYDRGAFESRIVAPAQGLTDLKITTIARVRPALARAFGGLGENVRDPRSLGQVLREGFSRVVRSEESSSNRSDYGER